MKHKVFDNLFVLEMANNHLGDIARGLEIIKEYAAVVRHNNVRAALKLQFRDVANFIHESYASDDERYIAKTRSTALSKDQFKVLIDAIREAGCIPMSTPFDEASVDLCEEFDFGLIKIASSDINDWPLIERIAETRIPVIVSTGGASLEDIDNIAEFFNHRAIPLAINHCVSLYPSEDSDLEVNQVDFLKRRYPDNVIGFSTHEKTSWDASMYLSYAKGARTWERHVDIEYNDVPVSAYNSLPHQIDTWFKAFRKAQEMCGGSGEERRVVSHRERAYLDNLLRGVYAKNDIPAGTVLNSDNFDKFCTLQIPLHKGQLSCREVINGLEVVKPVAEGGRLTVDDVGAPFGTDKHLQSNIRGRGRD